MGHVLKGVYQDPGADAYDHQCARALRRSRQLADTLGFALANRQTGELLKGQFPGSRYQGAQADGQLRSWPVVYPTERQEHE